MHPRTDRPRRAARNAAAFTSVLAFACICGQAMARTSPVVKINEATAKADVTTTKLRGNVAVLEGSGGNIGVLSGPDGQFMVDAGIAVSKDKIKAALAALGKGPVKYVVNTHWHWDHSDGNPWLQSEGAQIVATPATRKHVSQVSRVDDWDYTFQPLPEAARPKPVVTHKMTYTMDGETIEVVPISPAHTDGDLYVLFKKANVIFLGDTFWNGVNPFIDNEYGGSIDGTIRAVNDALKIVDDTMIVVPGHGPVGKRADLVAFRDMLVAVRNNVAELKASGKTLEQVQAAKPTAAFDEKWGKFVIDPDFFTQIVYDGLPPKKTRYSPSK
jgi:glyoxylase-like metal-dependent hydrolase (beta-lactamase superfamily II)